MAETGIGLSDSEYYFQADGFIDYLSVATDTEVAYWTPNYNGVNSYVEIPEWKPASEFIIQCDIYGSAVNYKAVILNNNANSVALNWDGRNGNVSVKRLGTANVTNIPVNSFGKILVTGSWVAGQSGITYIGIVGTSGSKYPFKGQISNLKLIDKTNPSNSRFYPGIIYSYVNPDATDAPMPSSTVLVDDWSGQHGNMINFGTTQPYVPLLGDREEYCGNYTTGGFVKGVDTLANRLSASGSASGSFSGKLSVGDVLTAEGVSLTVSVVVDANTVEYTSLDSDVAIQNAFQYPNSFKVAS